MRFACLLIDHLPVKAEAHRDLRLRDRPLIIARSSGSRRVVLDASPQTVGIQPGMPLSEAVSACKEAVLVQPDPVYYRSIFGGVLAAIEALGADVEESELGHAYVALTGLELLHGGEERLLDALLKTVPAYLAPRVGVGFNKFTAAVAAYRSTPGWPFCAPEDIQAFLAPLPVALLPVPWQTIARLESFGLRTLGQLADLPAGALQAQFGPAGRLMAELSHGTDRRPLLPRRHQEAVEASLTFPDPVGTMGIVLTAVENLLARVFAQPGMRGRFARVCTLEGALLRAPAWQKRMVFKEPLGDRSKALSLIRPTLEGAPPPAPLEELRLVLSGITGEGGRQESLFRDVRRQENLRETLRQLRARLGVQAPIYSVREVEPWSRLPERRQALVPFVP